jgi:uncharacterized protein (TIGR02147 family)
LSASIDIFDYHDYVQFFRDYLAERRVSEKRFSYRKLSGDAGLSPNYLAMVLSEQRTMSEKAFRKLLPLLDLGPQESRYLEHLYFLSEGDCQARREEAMRAIQRMRKYRKKNPQDFEAWKYLTNWLTVAIREMASIPDFEADPRWIQPRLAKWVPQKKIQSSLRFLLKHEFLKMGEGKRATQTGRPIRCARGVFSLAMAQFHQQTMELASESIDLIPMEDRSLTTATLTIPSEKYAEMVAIMQDAQEKIYALEGVGDSGNKVMQVSFLAFPLSKPKERKRL